MKRGVLEEKVHDEPAVDGSVDAVSCADDLLKRVLMCDDDQCSGLVFRHAAACLCQLVHRLCVSDGALSGPSHDPVDYGSAPGAVHISIAKPDEELSDFRLEDYDQSKDSHVQHHVHDGSHQSHVECRDQDADHIERNDCDEDAHGRGSSDPSEQEEYDEAEQNDVQDICDGQLQKAEKCKYHIPLYYNRAKIVILAVFQ